MTGKVSKRKAKRACIDCHYLAIMSLLWDHGFPGEVDNAIPSISGGGSPARLSHREQIRKKEDITLEDYGPPCDTEIDGSDFALGCYLGCWNEGEPFFYNKRYETVVETDCSDCCLFFEYKPGMSYEAAEKIQNRMALLQSNPNKNEINKTESERKAKQACINCHFLMRMQCFVEEDPLDKEATLVIHDETPVLYNMREQIENNDYNFNDLDGLGCYKRRWIEVNEEDKQKRYKVVVETDRGGCKYFFENNWLMSFEMGEREWKTLAGLEAYAQSIKKVVKRQEAEPKNSKKKESTKLRGKKQHYVAPEKRDKIIKEIIKTHPKESNTFLARKAMIEIGRIYGTKSDGTPLYAESTLAKEVSKLKSKKKKNKTA